MSCWLRFLSRSSDSSIRCVVKLQLDAAKLVSRRSYADGSHVRTRDDQSVSTTSNDVISSVRQKCSLVRECLSRFGNTGQEKRTVRELSEQSVRHRTSASARWSRCCAFTWLTSECPSKGDSSYALPLMLLSLLRVCVFPAARPTPTGDERRLSAQTTWSCAHVGCGSSKTVLLPPLTPSRLRRTHRRRACRSGSVREDPLRRLWKPWWSWLWRPRSRCRVGLCAPVGTNLLSWCVLFFFALQFRGRRSWRTDPRKPPPPRHWHARWRTSLCVDSQ